LFAYPVFENTFWLMNDYAERQQKEADTRGLSLPELQQLKTDTQDAAEARQRGTEVWELRMRRAGNSKLEIEQKRTDLRGSAS
jgi:hypothetical protein